MPKKTAGVFIDDDPHLIVSFTSGCDEIGRSLSEALLASEEVVAHPTTFDYVPSLFFQHSKTKSWKAFVKGARLFTIEIDENGSFLKDYGFPDSRGGYAPKDKTLLSCGEKSVAACALIACENIKEINER